MEKSIISMLIFWLQQLFCGYIMYIILKKYLGVRWHNGFKLFYSLETYTYTHTHGEKERERVNEWEREKKKTTMIKQIWQKC